MLPCASPLHPTADWAKVWKVRVVFIYEKEARNALSGFSHSRQLLQDQHFGVRTRLRANVSGVTAVGPGSHSHM